jgi:hypothetical protein
LYCREAEVVCKLVLLEVREDDGGKGGEERGAFVDGAVVNRLPYLRYLADILHTWHGSYCLRASFENRRSVEVLVVFYGIAILDDAFGAAEGRWGAASRSISARYIVACWSAYSSDVSAVGCI